MTEGGDERDALLFIIVVSTVLFTRTPTVMRYPYLLEGHDKLHDRMLIANAPAVRRVEEIA